MNLGEQIWKCKLHWTISE